MAVITRKSLQDKNAISIKNQALQRASLYNGAGVSQIQQQQALLGGQQQNLLTASQRTIGSLNQDVYRSQRQQRASSAASGLIGASNQAREATEIQNQVGYELGNIVNQAEQGAVSLASQQSALNQAEVTIAQNEILDIYANELIDKNDPSVSLDVGKQWVNGITGALSGIAAGVGLGAFGPKLGNKMLQGQGGMLAGSLIGAGAGFGGAMLGKTLFGIGDDYKSDGSPKGSELDETSNTLLMGGASLAGGLAGAGIKAFQKRKGAPLGKAMEKGFWTTKMGSKSANGISGLSAAGKATRMGKFGKMLTPTPLTLALGVAGGIIGGLQGGLQKKYKLDYNKMMESSTAKDFASMGVDLKAISGIISSK